MTTLAKRAARSIAASLLLVGVAACSTPFQADVSRFATQLPAPQGKTFAVVADDPELVGGLEFAQYARYVGAEMAELGYAEASPETADLLVRFDYGVNDGREKIRSFQGRDPFYNAWYGYGPAARGFYRGGPWGFGWQDPFFNSGPNITSYTVYTSGIDVKIDRRADGQRLFEGKAEAVSRSDRLPYLVPNLVDAMFTDFPGNSGETLRISIAPEDKQNKVRRID